MSMAEAPAAGPQLLSDVLSVIGQTEDKVWSETVCQRLAKRWPDNYIGWDPTTLSAALKPYGIQAKQTWLTVGGRGANKQGLRRKEVANARRLAQRGSVPQPQSAVLYRFFDAEGTLLYTGISRAFLNRLGQHRRGLEWFREVHTITLEHFDTRKEASAAERVAILEERPLHNTTFNGR